MRYYFIEGESILDKIYIPRDHHLAKLDRIELPIYKRKESCFNPIDELGQCFHLPGLLKILEKRTWRERLFVFPWKPFKKYKEIKPGNTIIQKVAYYKQQHGVINNGIFYYSDEYLITYQREGI